MTADDSYDVQMGPYKFSGRGPGAGDRFDAWFRFVQAQLGTSRALGAEERDEFNGFIAPKAPAAAPVIAAPQPAPHATPEIGLDVETMNKVFKPKGEVETLRYKPATEQPDADGALMLVYAFQMRRGEGPVLAGTLGEAVRESGLRKDRIDRIAYIHIRDNHIIKSGRGKGSRYGLSNPGVHHAEKLIRDAAANIASPGQRPPQVAAQVSKENPDATE